MKNLITSILLLLALLLPVTANAHDFEVDGIYYNYCDDPGTVEVTRAPYPIRYSGAVAIPEAVTYEGITYTVTAIDNYAFSSAFGLKSVTIPSSVITIEEHAFSSCDSLTSLTLPNSVITIGYCAFASCSSLTSMTIPSSVTSIGIDVFYQCENLTSIIYQGTTIEWLMLEKGDYWNIMTGSYVIHCTDGDLAK